MMGWDYRVFYENDNYTIHTVYYDKSGVIVACSENPIELFGESLETLQEQVELIQEALKKKVLSPAEVPKQQIRPQVSRGKSLQAVRQQLNPTFLSHGDCPYFGKADVSP